MIQHIEQLFEETKTIILPGLGALTITNPDTHELMFMPYLKHDDGVLKSFIASKEGISEDDAKSKLDGFVADIQAKLDAGQPATFGSMGNFEKDADGDIAFKNQEAETPAPVEDTPVAAAPIPEPITETPLVAEAPAEANVPEATETPIIDEAPAAEEAPEAPLKTAEEVLEPKAEVVPAAPEPEAIAPKERIAPTETTLADEIKAAEKEAPAPEPIPEPIPDVAPEIEAPVETTSPAATKTIAEEIEAAETAPKVVVLPVPPVNETRKVTKEKPLNILEKEEIASNQKKLNDLRAQKEAPKQRKKRGAGFYILMVFIVLIVGGGTYVGLNYDQFKDYLPFESSNAKLKDNSSKQIAEMKKTMGTNEVPENETEVTPETTEPETTETTPEVTTPEVAKPEVKKPQPKPQVTGSNNQPFHIVAGVFGSPENAERLATKIKGMGHPAKTFARGSQTVVSVQSFATKAEAEAALSNVKDAAPKGWVLEWRN